MTGDSLDALRRSCRFSDVQEGPRGARGWHAVRGDERPKGHSSMRMMTSKGLRRIGLALAIALPTIGLIAWFWVIPTVIVAAIRQRHEGYVRIAGWWIGGSSAGVTGLQLHEDAAPGSPTWAAVDRVTTDLSLGAILR